MAVQDSIVSSYATLIAQYPAARAKIWSTMAIRAAERRNVFTKLEGEEGSRKPIWRKNDFTKGHGDKITFTTEARLGAQARRGSQMLVGAEETAKLGNFDLQIDIIRHATGLTQKHKLLTAISLEGTFAALLGEHAGWTMENDMMMSYRKMAGPYNTVYAGNKGSVSALKSADVLTPSLIETSGELGSTNQAKSVVLREGSQGMWSVPSFLVVAPHPALTELRQSAQWQSATQYADDRGKDNQLWTGDFKNWDGHAILPHYVEDDDSFGPIGSPFAAKAYLGVAIAAGTAALTIQGGYSATGAALANPGGNGTGPAYFQFFENYDYQWVEGQTPNPQSGDQYVLIYNLVDSGIAAGNAANNDVAKFGFYRYETNNGYTLTTAAYSATAGIAAGRLSATANGGGADTRGTTVGTVTFSATVNTESHPAGSLILQTNAAGVPYAYGAFLGAGSAMRGYGEGGIQQIKNSQDYDFKKTQGYMAIYGQTPFVDTNGNPKRFVLQKYALAFASITLPVVT
jgi:N4-gp56 family major capsid protein